MPTEKEFDTIRMNLNLHFDVSIRRDKKRGGYVVYDKVADIMFQANWQEVTDYLAELRAVKYIESPSMKPAARPPKKPREMMADMHRKVRDYKFKTK
jgi:hypothetical protein